MSQIHEEGRERDILQLVEEAMRGALCLHAIADGLRGEDPSRIEKILKAWDVYDDSDQDAKERDILQLLDTVAPYLSPRVVKAIDHLVRSHSGYLDWLGQLAVREHDWQQLPDPFEP